MKIMHKIILVMLVLNPCLLGFGANQEGTADKSAAADAQTATPAEASAESSTSQPASAEHPPEGTPAGETTEPVIEVGAMATPMPPVPHNDHGGGDHGGGLSRATVLVGSLTVFALAVFVGFEVIAKVPPTLHTPLMSGSNAVSGVTVVGAIIAAGNGSGGFACFLALIATALATINVVGGFVVTHRMLMMFKKR